MILFLTLIFTSLRSFSQTVLTEGDIAFTRINIDDESFSFVLLVPITNSTQFIITDEAWDGSTLLAFESSIQFTATSTFLAGEEISISSTSLSASSSGSGTATLTSLGTINPTSGNMLGAAGDNLFIYQSSGAPGSNDFVTGINANGGVIGSPGNAWSTSTSSSNSLLPNGLTNGTNALGIFPNGGAQTEVDNARYKATALRSGDKATILAAIMDLTNWEYDNDFVQPPVGTSFTIIGGNTAPVIAGTSAGQAVNDNSTLTPFSAITTTDADGDNLTATITLDNNAKGVLSGAGLTGTGPYTIASTTPADLQAKLRGLSYNPTDNRTATTETTTFTVVINDGVDTDTDATTTVISSAVAPTVTSVTVPANATYIVSQNLDFTVNFDENVTVNTAGGTPQINLTIGATSRQATYQSGSGTAALLFRYTIQNSELDTDGIAVGTLAANGGTLRDSGSADANLTLNSIGSTTAVLVDAVAPTITSVTVPANATYIAGQNLDFTINTNENITVNTAGGTPQLSLTIGATTRQAVYQSGSGTSALLFRYTVQAGDLDTDGIAVGTLAANGGTLADAAGNNLNTTLNSVGSTTAVLVDAAPPTITSVTVPANATYITGQNLDFTINTNENITINTAGGTPQLSIIIGATTRQAVYQSGSGTSALLFRYTIQAGELDTDGIAVGTLATNGGTLRDNAGNNLNTTLNSVGNTTAVLVDAVAPTITSVTVPANATYIAGQNLDFTINTSENVTVNTTSGTPQLSLTIGATTRQAIYQSGSGTSSLLFRYTVQAGEQDTDGIAIGTLNNNGGTLRDGVGNNLNTTLNSVGSTTAVLVDAAPPTITSVTVPANANYIAGQNLDFVININENVTVNTAAGTPQLSLTIGATTRQAVYLSGSGTSALLFRYTIQAGELDNDGITVGTLSANGGTLRDAVNNNLNTTLNSVGSTTAVLVDAVAPTITSVTVPANATYITGQNLDFTINTNENTIVNTAGGTPQLSITIGATTRQAAYISGNGTSALLFRYTVQAGELDTDGIAVGTLAANGGTLRDAAGNNLNTTLNSVGSTTAVLVDAVAPTITSVTVPANATYITGQNLDFTINTSENTTINTSGGTPLMTITIGATTRQATYQSGSGTSSLLFRYTVQTGELDTDGITIGTLSTNGGTLRDTAGNDLNTTLNSVGTTTSVLVDAVPPTGYTVTIDQSPINAINHNAVSFTFAGAEIGTTYNYTFSTSGGSGTVTGSGTIISATDQITNIDVSGLSDGTITLGVTLTDPTGNTGAETLDTKNKKAIPPTATITISDDTLIIGETAVVTITFSEAVTGFDNTDLTIPNGTLSTLTSTDGNITFEATFTPTIDIEDNTNIIILDNTGITDSVGNDGTGTTNSPNFSIDMIIPTAIIEISDTELISGETTTVTITFSEAVTGFDNTDLVLINGTLTKVSSEDGNITFMTTFTPAEGIQSDTNIISLDNIGFTDIAGNEGTGTTNSINFSINTLAPTGNPLTFNKGFSPNGDGINDTWVIEGIENFPNHTIQVFNRSGRKIFEAKNYQNNWDGLSSGNSVFGNDKLPVGAYYYVLETGSKEVPPLTGWIYINY
ncbi:beta strand repeat-containing protein [Aquimarina muelleri]|uniref:beta strand repeat-containing protein n=1 Tax=Aquimarina muelleri TaxID=279356 RepID=UPI003F68893D